MLGSLRSSFRFSLRTLLIFVTIASATFGWVGVKVRQAERQKEIVAEVEKLGGGVGYDYQLDSMGNWDAKRSLRDEELEEELEGQPAGRSLRDSQPGELEGQPAGRA